MSLDRKEEREKETKRKRKERERKKKERKERKEKNHLTVMEFNLLLVPQLHYESHLSSLL